LQTLDTRKRELARHSIGVVNVASQTSVFDHVRLSIILLDLVVQVPSLQLSIGYEPCFQQLVHLGNRRGSLLNMIGCLQGLYFLFFVISYGGGGFITTKSYGKCFLDQPKGAEDGSAPGPFLLPIFSIIVIILLSALWFCRHSEGIFC
jgi:hypothetical protein